MQRSHLNANLHQLQEAFLSDEERKKEGIPVARNALSYSITMVTIQENQVMSRLIMMSLYLQTSLRRLRLRSRRRRSSC